MHIHHRWCCPQSASSDGLRFICVCGGCADLYPHRGYGVNGSENWVHLVEHLLVNCKHTEMGSSLTNGAAASKNNPVAQQLRNPAQMVTSAAAQSWQQVNVWNNVLRVVILLTNSITTWAGGYIVLKICWGFSVGGLGNLLLSLHGCPLLGPSICIFKLV